MQNGYAPVNGTRLYWEGEGDPFIQRTVVLIHGFGMDVRLWDELFPTLAREYHVLRYDLRGFGKSALPEGEYSTSNDLKLLLDFHGVERAVLCGLSIGARVAVDCALTYPTVVEGLILVDDGERV